MDESTTTTTATVGTLAPEIAAIDESEPSTDDIQEEDEIPPEVEVIQTEPPQQKKKKKAKIQDVPEDDSVDDDFVLQLDVSCVSGSPVAAPAVDDAYVLKYAR